MKSRRGLRSEPVANLPGQPTSFIGRGPALDVVSCRLAEHRLVSLVGPGGCGKTRLAIEVCRHTIVVQAHNVFFVDLSGLSELGLVPGAALRALGLREAPGQHPLETLTGWLSDQELLVLLDNCEHLLEACAELADVIARECPGVRLLATSRERLGVTGEAVVDVGGLELPRPAPHSDGDWLHRSEAGRLFVDRARMARADFAADGDNALVVATICERLDGIPLAIEMAAAQVRFMSVRAIADGLSDRFRLLTGGGRTAPPRHKTLLSSIEWSCGLLDQAERRLLYRLSVFASGFTLAAAEAVCDGQGVERVEVLGLLTSLVDKSLVQALPEEDRYRLHETMHAYCGAALEAEGSTGGVRDRHLDYFAALAKVKAPTARASAFALARRDLGPELDNLRTALRWSIGSQQFETGAKLLCSMGKFLQALGLDSEALADCWPFLAAEVQPSCRADILDLAAGSSRWKDPAMSLRLASELVSLGESLGDESLHARGLLHVAAVQQEAKPDEALEAATKAIAMARSSGQPVLEAWGLSTKGWALIWLGRPAEALAVGKEELEVSQDLDWPSGEATARGVCAYAAMCTGRLAQAMTEADELSRLSGELEPLFMANGDSMRAEVLGRLGQANQAAEAITRAISLASASGDTYFVLIYEACKGRLWVAAGYQDEGYEVLEAATAKLESFGLYAECVENRAVLAEVTIRRGDLVNARRHLDASGWKLSRGSEPAGAPIFRAEARLARAMDQPGRAHALACQGLAAASDGGHVLWVIDLLELVAVIGVDLHRHAEAARLFGAAERQREVTGYAVTVPCRDERRAVLDGARAALGLDMFERTMSEGRAITLQEAVAYARRGRSRRSRAASGWDSLTPSEQRVVSLVAQGLTNAEIAKQLFISVPTVKSHLNRVFDKLHLANRSQLAVLTRHGKDT